MCLETGRAELKTIHGGKWVPFRRLVIPRPPFYSLCRTSFIYNGLSQGQAFPSLSLSPSLMSAAVVDSAVPPPHKPPAPSATHQLCSYFLLSRMWRTGELGRRPEGPESPLCQCVAGRTTITRWGFWSTHGRSAGRTMTLNLSPSDGG